jgi:hypothetical protein
MNGRQPERLTALHTTYGRIQPLALRNQRSEAIWPEE